MGLCFRVKVVNLPQHELDLILELLDEAQVAVMARASRPRAT